MKFKRILAAALAGLLVVTSVPVTGWDVISVSAAETEYTYEEVGRQVLQDNATANTEQNPVRWDYDGTAAWAFDDSTATRWSTRYDFTEGLGAHDPNDVLTSEQKDTLFDEGGATAWIASGFGESILLGKIEYQGRTDGQKGQNCIGDWNLWTANVTEGTPGEEDWTLVASSVETEGAEKHDKFMNGELQTILLDAPVQATHFKLEALGVAPTIGSGDPHCVAASQIRVYKAIPLTGNVLKEALQEAVTAADEIVQGDYTDASWNAFTAKLQAAKDVLAKDDATDDELTAAKSELEAAIAALTNGYSKLPSSALTGDADSVELTGESGGSQGQIAQAVDGDKGTFWHTNWKDSNAPKAEYDDNGLTGNNNYYITLDQAYTVQSVTYLPRQAYDASSGTINNGAITKCEVYVATTTDEDGNPVYEETPAGTGEGWAYPNQGAEGAEENTKDKVVTFSPEREGVIAVKITALNSAGPQPNRFINAAEFGVVVKESEPEVITSLDTAAVTVTAPAQGGAAEAAAVAEDADYTAETSWKQGENEVALNTAFAPDTVYTVTVTLTPNASFEFTAETTVTLNGEEVSAELNEGKLVVTKEFEAFSVTKEEALAELAAYIATVKAVYDTENKDSDDAPLYTAETWDAFAAAYQAAQNPAEDATANDIYALKDALEEKYNALKEIVTETVINGLVVSGFDTPVQYHALKNPSIQIGEVEGNTHYTELADRAADPVALTLNGPNNRAPIEISNVDGFWAYSGQITAENDTAGVGAGQPVNKLDIFGADKTMIIRFKMKAEADQITGDQPYHMVGKGDNQYGVQVAKDKVLVYADATVTGTTNTWVQSQVDIDSSFWGKWHDVMVVFTGTKMQIYVDGVKGKADPNRTEATSITLKQNKGSVFTTGYNYGKYVNGQEGNGDYDAKAYPGLLADVQVYTTDAENDYTEGLTKSYEEVSAALDAAAPVFNLTLTPYQASTSWYKVVDGNDEPVAAGTQAEAGVVYKSVTTLTAHDGYKFVDTACESVDGGKAVADESGRTLTFTKTYEAAEEVECTCVIASDAVTFNGKTIALGVEDSKTESLAASATVSGDCVIPGHPEEIEKVFKVKDAGTTEATISDGVLTVKKPGTVVVTVEVKTGAMTAPVTKDATFTVTSDKATAEEKAALKSVIDDIAKLDEAVYTADSWKALQDKLTAANTVYAKGNASKTEVSTAKTNLENAKNALKTKVDAAKDEYNKIELPKQEDAEKYTAESWNAVSAALKAYNEEAEKPDADGAKLLELVDALNKAVEALKPAEPKEPAELTEAKAEVSKALAAAKSLYDAGQKDYTDATWKAFADAYKAAQNPAADADAAALKALAAALTKAQADLAKAAAPEVPVEAGKVYDSGNYSYKVLSVTAMTAEVVALNNKSLTSIKIFNTVTLGGKSFKVTSVAPSVFKNNKKIKSVVIGKNVTKIGKDAFSGCTGLKKLTLGASVKTIDKNSFRNCKKLSSIVVNGKAIKTIKSGAFKNTAKKMTIKVPKKLAKKQRTALLKKFKKAGVTKKAKMK